MEYITKTTRFPPFIPCPASLLSAPLADGAKMTYLALFNRATLSLRNGWADENGHVYIIYPIDDLVQDVGKCRSALLRILHELEAAGYIRRVPQGYNRPNRVFVLYDPRPVTFTGCPQTDTPDARTAPPPVSENSDAQCPKNETPSVRKTPPPVSENPDAQCPKNETSSVRNIGRPASENVPPNYTDKNYTDKNYTNSNYTKPNPASPTWESTVPDLYDMLVEGGIL